MVCSFFFCCERIFLMLWPLCIQPYRLLMSSHLTKPNKRLKKEGTWWFFLVCTGSAQT